MKKANTPLYGIRRNIDDGLSSDGECLELINARISNGSIEPVGSPIMERQFTRTPVYIHKNINYEHYITYSDDNVYYECDKTAEGYTQKNVLIGNIPALTQINSIGNILIMGTRESMFYAIFVNGEYSFLGEKPSMPTIFFYLRKDVSDKTSDSIWCGLDSRIDITESTTIDLNDTAKPLVNSSFKGSTAKFLAELEEDKKIIYPLMVRYAIRLFDGTYIMHSQPILLNPESGLSIAVQSSHIDNGALRSFNYKVTARPSSIIIYPSIDLGSWKHVAQSIDIFATRRIVTDNMEEDVTSFYYRQGNVTFNLPKYSTTDLKQKIEEASQFYLVKSIPLDTALTDNSLFENVSDIKNIEQKELLPLDSYTHNTIGGEMMTYNSRLHVGNVKMRHCPPLPINNQVLVKEGNGVIEVASILKQEVHIKTDSGIKIVHGSEYFYRSSKFSSYMSYPDSRAFKLVLYDGISYKTFSLKAHSYLNIAYSLEKLTPYSITDFTSGAYSENTEDAIEVSPSKLKASGLGNPFYFPAKQTYTVSSRDIIGMAAATTALSTGQFGQFPLYVFTKEGVYALSTGNGETAYSNSYPINRYVCSNGKSIVSTDNAVAFASVEGIMLLSGSSVENISAKMEGFLSSVYTSSPLVEKISKVSGLYSILTKIEFRNFIEGAVIGYNYEDKELIVSNKVHGYSYVYGLNTGEWHKISFPVESFLNSYPESLSYSKGGVWNMHNGHRTINNILLMTRPVKFGSITHKRILQSALRGVVKPSLSDIYLRGEPVMFRDENIGIFSNCGFYVLGSNDCEHFSLLSGREKIEDVRDLITKMNKTKAYKYFMFCLSGGVRTDVSINYIETIIDETYQNRLR